MHLHILTLSKLDTPNFKKAKQITPNNHRKTIIFNKQYIVNTYVNKTSVTSSPYGGADNHGVNRKSVSISGVAHPVFIDYPWLELMVLLTGNHYFKDLRGILRNFMAT